MTMRFRFRLEGLLKLRKALEEDAQRALAKTIQVLNALDLRIQQLEGAHRDTVASRRFEAGEVMDLERWRAIERYLVALEHRVQEAQQERAEAEKRVEEARKALVKAHQAHLMLLRLRERRFEQHTQEALHDETRNLDEIAILRYRFNTIRPSAVMAPEVSP